MRLTEKGIISEEAHEALSKSLLISVVRPNMISRWFQKTSLQLTVSEIADSIVDSWQTKKKKKKSGGLISILGGRNDSDSDKK